MSVRRYLLNLSYLGTPFRGTQRQVKGGDPRPKDPTTVQGMLEIGLKYINPTYDTVVYMASRTDAGVHALNATCHFDLRRPNDFIFEPNNMTYALNRFFNTHATPIRILNSKIVPDDFHCRLNAKSRTYLYRMIIGRHEEEKLHNAMHFLPIEEYHRVHFCSYKNFDVDTMRKAAKMFEGLHDFRTFMGTTRVTGKCTRKVIYNIDIIERKKSEIGVSSSFSWPTVASHNTGPDSHIILDIYIKGKGFLYKQVRRTTATLLTAATGRISLEDIQCMLEVPSKHSWIPKIKTLPGCGLYLCEIEY